MPNHLFLFICCCLSLYSSYAYSGDSSECFYVDQEECKQILKQKNFCDAKTIGDSRTVQVICCNITSEKQIIDFTDTKIPDGLEVLGVHIRDSNLTSVHPANLFYKLKPEKLASLTITNSNITMLPRTFGDGIPGVTCLNMSVNYIGEMDDFAILKLEGLKNLVMRNNTGLNNVPHLPFNNGFIELDVSGNNDLLCKYLLNLTQVVYENKMQINQVNKNSTICMTPNVYFNNPYRTTMEQVERSTEIFKYCPSGERRKCTCSVYSSDYTENGTMFYQALVNCSRQGLVSLPKVLPPNTKILDVSNNNITSLEGIANSSYGNILILNADNNKITSMVPLEGTKFIEFFQELYLARNKIDQIHEHIFINAFDRRDGKFLRLAGNILKCDCRTATSTKAWLLNFKKYVTDYNEVNSQCTRSIVRVIEMEQKDNCPVSYGFGYKYLIAAEIFVFVVLVAKVSYDYYVFKTYGYLPWPASRMPKLPCDWCFET